MLVPILKETLYMYNILHMLHIDVDLVSSPPVAETGADISRTAHGNINLQC